MYDRKHNWREIIKTIDPELEKRAAKELADDKKIQVPSRSSYFAMSAATSSAIDLRRSLRSWPVMSAPASSRHLTSPYSSAIAYATSRSDRAMVDRPASLGRRVAGTLIATTSATRDSAPSPAADTPPHPTRPAPRLPR